MSFICKPTLDKLLDSSIVAKTRKIKSNTRLLTVWETEILELMEDNGVDEKTIDKVLRLLWRSIHTKNSKQMNMFLSMKEIYDLDAEYFETNAVIRELHEINEYARKRR